MTLFSTSLSSQLASQTQFSSLFVSTDLTNVLTGYQGQQVYIQFEQQHDNGCWPLNFDNLSLLMNEVQLSARSQANSIPTLDAWGLIILGLLMVIVSVKAYDDTYIVLSV